MQYACKKREMRDGVEIRYFDVLDSTANFAKRYVATEEKLHFPFAVVADSQTAGRGRLSNRSFYSPDGGLYFNYAVPERSVACDVRLITVAAGVATARAIESLCDCSVDVKWVNDLLCGGKKVAGILCESVYCERIAQRVYSIGIGVNLSASALAGFLPDKAGALPHAVDRDKLFRAALRDLQACLGDKDAMFLPEYNRRLSVCGKRIALFKGHGVQETTVLGASADGLICRDDNGVTHCVRGCDEIVTDLYDLAKQSGSK